MGFAFDVSGSFDPPGPFAHAGADLVFDAASVRELDRAAIEDFGLPGVVLMENAGRGAAAWLGRLVPPASAVLVACGPGGNGGDGWVLARHLANAGGAPRVFELASPREGSDAWIHRRVALAMGIPRLERLDEAGRAGATPVAVVDALFGTGLARPLEGAAAAAVDGLGAIARTAGAAVVCLDLPSGLDADTGEVLGTAPVADCTLTFVGAKAGLLRGEGPRRAGAIVPVDIGSPAVLARRLGRPRARAEGPSTVGD